MRELVTRVWLLGSMLAAPSVSSASQVLVVEPTGTYPTFSAAHSAAAEGDTIIVKAMPDTSPWNYGEIALGGKGVTVVGQPNSTGSLPLCSTLKITNLAAHKTITVRGLSISQIGSGFAVLTLESNAGKVVLEDVHMPTNGLNVANSIKSNANLTFVRFSGVGQHSPTLLGSPFAPFPALTIFSSTVFAYDCHLVGGDGKNSPIVTHSGAPALIVAGGSYFAFGGSYIGGNGAPGVFTGLDCLNGGNGGAGIQGALGPPTIYQLGALLQGGLGAAGPSDCFGSPGVNGAPLLLNGANSVVYNAVARKMVANSPVRVGETIHLSIAAPAGESTFAAVSFDVNPVFVPALKGSLIPALPIQLLAFPPLPGSGVLNLDLTVPALLPPGIPALDVAMQLLAPGDTGLGIVGTPTIVTVLHPSL